MKYLPQGGGRSPTPNLGRAREKEPQLIIEEADLDYTLIRKERVLIESRKKKDLERMGGRQPGLNLGKLERVTFSHLRKGEGAFAQWH